MDPKAKAALAAANAHALHGTRGRYEHGCRCMLCRAANARYESNRRRLRAAGDWNGMVDAKPARDELVYLSRYGLGKVAVNHYCGVTLRTLSRIKAGQSLCTMRTLRRILNVGPRDRFGRALIPAAGAWRKLSRLIAAGYTKAQLARWLYGPHARAIQIKRHRITAENAQRVNLLYERIKAGFYRRP